MLKMEVMGGLLKLDDQYMEVHYTILYNFAYVLSFPQLKFLRIFS